MSFGFEYSGLDELQQMLARIREAGGDTTKPRKLIREEMLLRTQLRFSAGVAPDGTRWPASARALGFGGQTLFKSGRLERSVHCELEGDDLVYYSDDIRARIHNDGGIVHAKPGKALAIPMSMAVAEAYRAGVSIREQYPDAFLLKSEGGNAFIVRRAKGAKGAGSMLADLEFLFFLTSSIEEPKRTFVDFGPDDMEMVEATLTRHFSAAEGGH